ncbi:MAG: RecX family transcriptional regulator [Bacteroidales bacterium]|nr:RecX family transcriptional regulator [Bacteroidales bacterium]
MKQKNLNTFEQGLEYAKKYCSLQENSAKDVKDKLIKKGLDYKTSEKIVGRLIEEDYINEQRFADIYTRSKIRQSRWGRIKIKRMLMSKGISLKYINKSFAAINEEEYKQVLEHLFNKKLSSLKVEDNYQRKYRLQYFLTSHGFETELIEDLFKEYGL